MTKIVFFLPSILSLQVQNIPSSQEITNITHRCTDGSRPFSLTFTYEPTIVPASEISLANVQVGSCDSTQITTSSNPNNPLEFTIESPDPWNCGISDSRNSSASSFSYEIGFNFETVMDSYGISIVTGSYQKSVSCEFLDSYSASLSFLGDVIQMETVDDGESESDSGNVSFEIKSFSDSSYSNQLENGTVYEAGSTAFLEIDVSSSSNFDSELMEWSVKTCFINETSTSTQYTLFDSINDSCNNDLINLNFTSTGNTSKKRLEYLVFLLSGLDSNAQNYEISCDIEVCMKSVNGSVCDNVSQNCGLSDWEDSLDPFEDLICEAGEDVTDRPEIYADFEADVCGPFSAFFNCAITNVICLGDGTFSFDFELSPILPVFDGNRNGVNCGVQSKEILDRELPEFTGEVVCI